MAATPGSDDVLPGEVLLERGAIALGVRRLGRQIGEAYADRELVLLAEDLAGRHVLNPR